MAAAVHTVEGLRARCIEEGDCLLWQGYFAVGTPMVSDNRKMTSVRKLFTQIITGEAKRGGFFVAGCGNRSCVEPTHTVWRTQRNHAMAMNKKINGSASAKLINSARISATKRRVSLEAIRDMQNSSERTVVLAERYGLSKAMVNMYRSGKAGATLATNPFAGLIK